MKKLFSTVLPVVQVLVLASCGMAQPPPDSGSIRWVVETSPVESRGSVHRAQPVRPTGRSATQPQPAEEAAPASPSASTRAALDTDIARLGSIAAGYDPAAERARLADAIRRAIEDLRAEVDRLARRPVRVDDAGQSSLTSNTADDAAKDAATVPNGTAVDSPVAAPGITVAHVDLLALLAQRLEGLEQRVDRLEAVFGAAGALPLRAAD